MEPQEQQQPKRGQVKAHAKGVVTKPDGSPDDSTSTDSNNTEEN